LSFDITRIDPESSKYIQQLLAGLENVNQNITIINTKLAEQKAIQLRVAEVAGQYNDKLKSRMEFEIEVEKKWREVLEAKYAANEDEATAEQEKHNRIMADLTTQLAAEEDVYRKAGKSATEFAALRQKYADKEDEERKRFAKADEERADAAAVELKDAEAMYKQAKQLTKQREIQNTLQNKLAKTLGMSYRFEESMLGKAILLSKNAGGIAGSFKAAGGFLKEAVFSLGGIGNIGSSILSKVAESTALVAKEVNSATTSFNKLTGAGGSYDEMIISVQANNREFNVDAGKTGEAMQALYGSFAQFTTLGKPMQEQLVTTAARLSSLGISSESSAKLVSGLVQSLKLTGTEADSIAKGLYASASEIGIVPFQMIDGFNSALPTLAAYGKQSIKIYKDLAAAAKATSIATDRLISLMSQFDTFEGAAQAAGNLNALLGGDLFNSMELMNASEEERIRIIKKGLDLGNIQFGQLGKYQQKAIAAAVGITDMAEANNLFGMSLTAYDDFAKKSEKAAMTEERFKEVTQAATSIVEKLANMVRGFAVAVGPLLTVLNKVLDVIVGITSSKSFGTFATIAGGVMTLVGAFKLLGVSIMNLKLVGPVLEGLQKGFGKVASMIGDAATKATAKLKQWTTRTPIPTGAPSASPIPGGAGPTLPGDKAKGGACGWVKCMKGFFKAVNPAKVLALGAGFSLLGAGFLLLGGGIGLAAWGMSELMKSINGREQVIGMLAFFYGLIAVVLALGYAGIAATPGLFAVGLVVGAIALAVAVATNSISNMTLNITNLVSALSQIKDVDFTVSFKSIKQAIVETSEAISKNENVKSFQEMLTVANSVTDESVKRTQALVNTAKQYVEVQATMKSPDTDAFVTVLKSALGIDGTANNKEKQTANNEIVLELDGYRFGKVVAKALNNRMTVTPEMA